MIRELLLLRANMRSLRKNRIHAVAPEVADELRATGLAETPRILEGPWAS